MPTTPSAKHSHRQGSFEIAIRDPQLREMRLVTPSFESWESVSLMLSMVALAGNGARSLRPYVKIEGLSARVLLVLAALFAAGPVSAVGVLRQTAPPAMLVLRRADLGAAYTGRGAPIDNSAAARGAPAGFAARLVRWGRIGGYEVDYTRHASPATLQDGPLAITSSASVYRSTSGARAAFAYSRRHLVPPGFVLLPLGFAVGEEARQWVSSGLGTMLEYIVIWREGEIDASIALTGRVGVVSAADIAPLALKQESRIRAALRRGRTRSKLP